jgi:hypothetical protein
MFDELGKPDADQPFSNLGHSKPIAAFGVRILEARPDVLVTIFTVSSTYPKLLAEIDRISGQAKVPKEDIMRRF